MKCARFQRRAGGFTLMELMVVLAIIAILVVMALPSDSKRLKQPLIKETLKLGERFQEAVEHYYMATGEFPSDNEEARLPAAQSIKGNYLSQLAVADGAIHLTLGNKIGEPLVGKRISLRPIYVPGEAGVPISWICGYDYVPDGMLAAGNNLTDIDRGYLPFTCR